MSQVILSISTKISSWYTCFIPKIKPAILAQATPVILRKKTLIFNENFP
jgi:hypothetical protein